MNECKRLSDCPADRLGQCRGQAVQARCDALQGLLNKADQQISELTHSAPMPPAGDVEVLGWRALGSNFNTEEFAVEYAKWAGEVNPVTELVDRTIVTRLAAERDEEAFWRKEAREGWGQATKVIEMQRSRLDEQEAELTKARELLAARPAIDAKALHTVLSALCGPAHHIRELQFCRGLPDSPIDQLQREFNDWIANPIAHHVDENCGQDAEAAKGGES